MLKKKEYLTDERMGIILHDDFPYSYGESSSSPESFKNTNYYSDSYDSFVITTPTYSPQSPQSLHPKTILYSTPPTTPITPIVSNNLQFNRDFDIDTTSSANKIKPNVDLISNDSYNSVNITSNISNISGVQEMENHIINISTSNNNTTINNTNNTTSIFFIKNILVKEIIFEFIGTFIYVLMGNGIYSQIIIYGLDNKITFIDWFYISIGWGLSLIFGTYVSLIGNDNGYLNPAIALIMYLLKKISFNKLKYYTLIYFIAAYLASAVIYLLNIINIKKLTYDINTANIFSTYKNNNISLFTGFYIDSVIMVIFTFIYLCINKKLLINNFQNNEAYCKMIGLLFIGLSLGFGYSTQMAINPASDLGSRLFTLTASWHEDVFIYQNYWFWIPIIAPYLGSIIGFIFFYIIVESQ